MGQVIFYAAGVTDGGNQFSNINIVEDIGEEFDGSSVAETLMGNGIRSYEENPLLTGVQVSAVLFETDVNLGEPKGYIEVDGKSIPVHEFQGGLEAFQKTFREAPTTSAIRDALSVNANGERTSILGQNGANDVNGNEGFNAEELMGLEAVSESAMGAVNYQLDSYDMALRDLANPSNGASLELHSGAMPDLPKAAPTLAPALSP